MATWLEQQRIDQQRLEDIQKDWPIIKVMTSYHPAREGGSPYKIDTVDDHATKPRQRWYESYAALLAAVERANPGARVEEA